MDEIEFPNGAVGDGSGQTIAIVVAFHHANLLADVNQFSAQYGLPLFNQPGGPTLTFRDQNGGTSLPGPADGLWIQEAVIGATYAHVSAPKANIVVVEAPNALISTLFAGPALQTAGNLASVVSMSWGAAANQLTSSQLSTMNSRLAKAGVTFLAGAGNGTTPLYPAMSTNAVAVGGTVFSADTAGHYISETGYTQYFGANRSFPDVAMSAATTVAANFPIVRNGQNDGGGGTSLASPFMAGVVAVANQGRALNGLGPIKLAQHSNISAADVRDITSGNGAFPGFDSSTGVGSPKADKLVAAWSGSPVPAPRITDFSAPAQANIGDQIQFVTGANGSVNQVEIWRDTNNTNQLDGGDTLLNTDTAERWEFLYAAVGPPSPLGNPTTFFARGQDSNGVWSAPLSRDVVINANASSPVVTSFTATNSMGGEELYLADSIRLGVTATDSDGTVAAVKFYRDTNGDGTLNSLDALLGTASFNPSTARWELVIDPNAAATPEGGGPSSTFSAGDVYIFAVAVDNLGNQSLGAPLLVTLYYGTCPGGISPPKGG